MEPDQQDHLPRQPAEVRVPAAVPQAVRQETAALHARHGRLVQLCEERQGEEGQEEEAGERRLPGHQDQGAEAEHGPGGGGAVVRRVQPGVPGGEAAQGEEEEEKVEAQEAEEAPQARERVQRFQLHVHKLALLSHHPLALSLSTNCFCMDQDAVWSCLVLRAGLEKNDFGDVFLSFINKKLVERILTLSLKS